MATKYKATLTVECWKQHTCICCAGTFRYRFQRTQSAEAGTKEAAGEAVRNAIVHTLVQEVDVHPCPSCGCIQPDMVGTRRYTWHAWLLFLTLAALVVPWILIAADALPYHKAAAVVELIAIFVLAGNALITFSNPNGDLNANRNQALQAADRGVLEKLSDGKTEGATPDNVPSSTSTTHLLALVGMAVAMLAFGVCEIERIGLNWPLNPGWYPGVVGPGDSPYQYIPGSINSIKGMWSGSAKAEVVNAKEAGVKVTELSTMTHTDSWGNSISAKSSEKNSSPNLWAYVKFPDDPSLTGKELKVSVDLHVTFPSIGGGGNQFNIQQQTFTQTTPIELATPHAGEIYRMSWWVGFAVGSVLLAAMCLWLLMLASSHSKQALPTSLEVIS